MKRLRFLCLSLAIVILCAPEALPADFVPGEYQSSDGALLLVAGGQEVEPYFATKALLAAQDAGLDVRQAAMAWINWGLPRQIRDGRLDQYCRTKDGQWRRCRRADADDSMLALWLQLLYRLSPDSGLPQDWQQSAAKAQAQLFKLRNHRLGVYHISSRDHVALFMDNVEVYAALKDMARAQDRFGDHDGAEKTEASARDLAVAIQRIFWDKRERRFRTSTQKNPYFTFYPGAVAQTYPLLALMPVPGQEPRSAWAEWRNTYGQEWLEQKADPHPWGLLALTAVEMGDSDSGVCWLARSEPFRYSQHWNLLEEAIFQGLGAKLAEQRRENLSACSRAMAKR